MSIRVTAKKSKQQTEDYTLWDNKVVITGLSPKIDISDVIDLADDNGGKLINKRPLTFLFYECGQRWISVEVDNFIDNLEKWSA